MGPGIYHMRLNYKDQACEKDWTWERDCSEVKRNYPVGDTCKGKDAGCQWERTRMLSSVWNQQRQKGVKGKDSPKWMSTLKYCWIPPPQKKKTQLIVSVTQLSLNCTYSSVPLLWWPSKPNQSSHSLLTHSCKASICSLHPRDCIPRSHHWPFTHPAFT